MSNKIDGPGPGIPLPATTQGKSAEHRQDVGHSRATRSEAPGESARVRVTDTALKMKRLEEKIKSLPDVDEARINDVREKLDSGQLEINKGRIADKLILFEKEID